MIGKRSFPFGFRPIFSCELLVLGRVGDFLRFQPLICRRMVWIALGGVVSFITCFLLRGTGWFVSTQGTLGFFFTGNYISRARKKGPLPRNNNLHMEAEAFASKETHLPSLELFVSGSPSGITSHFGPNSTAAFFQIYRYRSSPYREVGHLGQGDSVGF